jgi:ribosomal protein S21
LIWEELLEDAGWRFTACEQLAVYHERRTKNFKKALEYARLGLRTLTDTSARSIYEVPSVAEIRRTEGLSKRVTRLEARIRIALAYDAAPLLRRGRSSAAAD